MSADSARLTAALSDRYKIERELGQGGMATVYLAQDLKHDRKVAIKVLKPELAAVLGAERFLSEIRVTANLQHPNLLPLFDSGAADGFLYYVMPYVEGETLRARLDREGQLPIDETLRIVTLLAGALDYAHDRGVIHRDLKPENILLQAGQPVIADFGIALAVAQAGGSRVTETGLALGTPNYMSPEQAAGHLDLDAKSDEYALAAVTYEMLAGEPPHTGPSAQAIVARLMTEKPRSLRATRSEVPLNFDRSVVRALAKSRADRFPTCGAFATALGARPTPTKFGWLVPRSIAAVLLLSAVGWLLFGRGRSVAARSHTLAILPFSNEGGDTTQEYLAFGITDAVQVFLQKVPGLVVIGQASAAAASVKGATAQQIGQRLGVDQFLRGSIRRRGDSVRVTAELVASSDGHTLWTQRFDRPSARIYTLDDDIAEPLVAELQLALSGKALASARAGHTQNPRAYDQYLLGRHALDRLTEAGLRAAIAHFDSAVAIDSGFALAYTGVAEAWSWLADEYVSSDSAYQLVKRYAQQALSLDSLVAPAHSLLGMGLFIYDHDGTVAEVEYRRGITLDSNSVVAQEYYADFLTFVRPRECRARADRAVAMDPMSGFAAWVRASCMYTSGQYQEAVREQARMNDLQPGLVYADHYGAASLRELGRYDEAVAAYRQADSSSNKPLFGLGVTYARMGLRDSALRVAHDLEALSRRRYISPDMIAYIYANLPTAADRDRAFHWLREGDRVNSVFALIRDVAPELAPIRNDPRYREESSRSRLH